MLFLELCVFDFGFRGNDGDQYAERGSVLRDWLGLALGTIELKGLLQILKDLSLQFYSSSDNSRSLLCEKQLKSYISYFL